jgi:hypothetical protein
MAMELKLKSLMPREEVEVKMRLEAMGTGGSEQAFEVWGSASF